VGHYRVNNGRPGHTNGTGCALWSSANEVHGVVALCGPISSPRQLCFLYSNVVLLFIFNRQMTALVEIRTRVQDDRIIFFWYQRLPVRLRNSQPKHTGWLLNENYCIEKFGHVLTLAELQPAMSKAAIATECYRNAVCSFVCTSVNRTR